MKTFSITRGTSSSAEHADSPSLKDSIHSSHQISVTSWAWFVSLSWRSEMLQSNIQLRFETLGSVRFFRIHASRIVFDICAIELKY